MCQKSAHVERKPVELLLEDIGMLEDIDEL